MKLSCRFRECFTCDNFKHFELEIYIIGTYPDHFGSENCIFKDQSTYKPRYLYRYLDTNCFFSLLSFDMCACCFWFLCLFLIFGTLYFDSRNLDDDLGTFFKDVHIILSLFKMILFRNICPHSGHPLFEIGRKEEYWNSLIGPQFAWRESSAAVASASFAFLMHIWGSHISNVAHWSNFEHFSNEVSQIHRRTFWWARW